MKTKDIVLVVAGVLVAALCVFAVAQNRAPATSASDLSSELEPDPIAIASPTAAPVTPLSAAFPKNRDLRVLFVGDSLTSGLYASTEAASFEAIESAALEQAGTTKIVQAAKAGAGTGVVADITAVPDDLGLAVVELGTNDAGGQVPIDQFRATYAALLDRITASQGVALVCLGTWLEAYIGEDYDAVISDECTARGGRFVSLNDAYNDEANRGPAGVETWIGTSDDFHPNDAGHAAIAALIAANVHLQPAT